MQFDQYYQWSKKFYLITVAPQHYDKVDSTNEPLGLSTHTKCQSENKV